MCPYLDVGAAQTTTYASSSLLPYNIPGLAYWLDPDRYNDVVAPWIMVSSAVSAAFSRESSGGQLDTTKTVLQTTAGQRPTINLGDTTFGGKNSLSFNVAATQWLSASSAWSSAQAQPWTAYAVVAPQTGSTQRNIISAPSSIMHINTAGNPTLYAGVNLSGSVNMNAGDNLPKIVCGVANGASSAVYANNPNIALASGNASAGNITQLGIGGSSTSNTFDGKLATVLVYNGAHDANTRALVMGWLRGRYTSFDDSTVPYMVGGLAYWLDPDRYADWTLNGTKVASATSKESPSGAVDATKTVTQATDGNRPTLNVADSAFNGRNTLSFSYASSQILRAATTTAIPAPQTVYVVASSTGTTADTHRMTNFDATGANNKGSLYQAITTGLGVARGTTNLVVSTTNVSDGVNRVYCGIFNGTSSALYLNNATIGWSSTTGLDTFDGISIGGLVSSQTWDGKIATVLVFSGAHDQVTRAYIMGWLGARYGITVGGL